MTPKIAPKAKFFFILLTLVSFIQVKAQLKADFSATPISGCAPLLVKFTDSSTGAPTAWKWDLGNGTISFVRNPSVTYFNPGKYTIKLVVKTWNNADSVIKTDYIEVFGKPTVKFGSTDTTGCFPLPVQFTDLSTGGGTNVSTWLWDFGDGITSNIQNPSHTYTAGGNFNVTLLVKNASGCSNSLSKTPYVQINTGVRAKFTNNLPSNCTAPVTINFQNQSTGTGTLGYQWLFGDSTESTDVNPVHTYAAAGNYTIKLIVFNSNGCTDTFVKANAISLGLVSASFQMPDSACPNTIIQFTNTSSPTPASVKWSFADNTSSVLFNPTKSFTTAGTYSVKMVANFGACMDSITRPIQILQKPVIKFSAVDSNNCVAPFAVDFSNQSTGGVSYVWDFGDGTATSTWQTPSHTYTKAGNYTVKLKVTNANGCTDSLSKQSFIVIKKPKITFTNLPDSNCAPFTKTFSATVNAVDPVTSYLWDLSDGSTSTLASPTNTYTNPGTYPVSLIVNTAGGCGDTAILPRGIIANSKPVAGFSATPLSTCAKVPVKFADTTRPAANKWLWNFGNGVTSVFQNPSYQYIDTGFFDVTLIAWNKGCPDTVKVLKYIHISPPIAKYSVASTCSKPYERVFTDQSTGADQWLWDFGDNTTSTTKSPVHVYGSAGTYTVNLTVFNSVSGCDYTTTKNVQIIDAKAQFTASDTVVCRKSTVSFTTNISLNDVNLFEWRFGDSNLTVSSTRNTISKIYTTSGLYSVRLIITNLLGCKDTLTKANYIAVNGPVAKFATITPGSCLSSAVGFKDSSKSDGIHAITQWVWNYGDHTIDTLTSPPYQHNYLLAGSYPVLLKITDAAGCTDSAKLASNVIVSQPFAGFKSADTINCPGKQVQLKDTSVGLNLTYNWNFGDNATPSAAISPAHSYSTPGNYSITLIVTDQYGCKDTAAKTDFVKVVSPLSRFLMSDSISSCPPLIVDFSDSSDNAISYFWDFGDSTYSTTKNPSHFYSYPGTYTVRQTVTSHGGCTDFTERTIEIKGPRGTFTYNPLIGCKPLSTSFTAHVVDAALIVWDFNDGNTESGMDSVVSYSYAFAGSYVPKMILTNNEGCAVPVRGKDTIIVNGISTSFSIRKTLLCDSGVIAFKDSSFSNDLITGYQWSFGDGKSSTLQSPSHQYTATAIYYPSLTITSLHGCSDKFVSSVPVRVVASPKIKLNSSADGCVPLTANFTGQLLVPDTSLISWKWNFANGSTAAVKNPAAQIYTTGGLYKIIAIATNSSGCTDTVVHQLEAYALPNVNAGPPDTILCKGGSVLLSATGAVNYSWSPSTGLSCTNCANATTTSYKDITYLVKGTDAHGCSSKDSIGIIVKNRFNLTVSGPDTLCKGSNKKMSAAGANLYSWTPTAGLDDPLSATPTASPDTTTKYRVIGLDGFNCFQDTGFVSIKVYPIPVVEAGPDKTINVGQSYDLVPKFSPDVDYVFWQPTSGLFRNIYPGITVKPTQNTEYTVEVKNRGGCAAKDRVTVFVICNGSNVFIPNTFSPNGDGVNEIFYPRGSGLFKIKTFRIFNRWGQVVFEKESFDANNPSDGWDGTFKGARLNSDIFIYTIEILCDNQSVLTYHGNVALVK